jgi:hypothetical protein
MKVTITLRQKLVKLTFTVVRVSARVSVVWENNNLIKQYTMSWFDEKIKWFKLSHMLN